VLTFVFFGDPFQFRHVRKLERFIVSGAILSVLRKMLSCFLVIRHVEPPDYFYILAYVINRRFAVSPVVAYFEKGLGHPCLDILVGGYPFYLDVGRGENTLPCYARYETLWP
jgi:hypothetical protein